MPVTCPKCGYSWIRHHGVRTRHPRAYNPDITVSCACGARWSGRHAVDNTNIDAHRDRERRRVGGCKVIVDDRRDLHPSELSR